MGGLFEFLDRVKEKPGMYLGIASVTHLRLFLVGYRFARSELNITSNDEEVDFYRNFQPWLQKRLRVYTTNSWDKIILIQSANEKEAFQSFFVLLDEFCQRDKSQDIDPILVKSSSTNTEKVA
jgi:hypothetical protein